MELAVRKGLMLAVQTVALCGNAGASFEKLAWVHKIVMLGQRYNLTVPYPGQWQPIEQ